MTGSQISGTIKIFFSLTPDPTSKDRGLFEELQKQLRSLMRPGDIDVLYDSLIIPGSNIGDAIKAFIRSADIIVFLLSADFFASDQCVEKEMKYVLEQHAVGNVDVVPVLLRPTGLGDLPAEQFRLLPPNGTPVSSWADQDEALLEVARGIREAVDKRLKHRLINTFQSISGKLSQFPLCVLPYRFNPFFTDRKDILAQLHRSFTSGQDVQIRMQALQGQAGVGKTIIAIEYIRRYQREYQPLLWLNAAPSELLSASIVSLADQLGLSLSDGSDQQERFAAIRYWLQHHEQWFVVIDNLEDFTLINQLIPLHGNGHVLVITHNQDNSVVFSPISVSQMSIEEGALLLLRRATLIPEQSSLITAYEADFIQAQHITSELKGYPLALDLVGAYIKETRRSLASYLQRFRRQRWWTHLFGGRRRFKQDYLDLLTATLALTFQVIARTHPNALKLLRFFAFLHSDALSYEMLLYGAPSLTSSLRPLIADRLVLDDLLATLQKFSLIHQHADSSTFYMHGTVQLIVRKQLTKKVQAQFAQQAVLLVNSIFPDVLYETWEECKRYLPQAQHCSRLIHELQIPLKDAGLLLERLGFYYYQRGCYPEATIYLTQALRHQEQYHPHNLSDMAQTLNSLGLLSQRQARYQDAKVLHERALKLRESISDEIQMAESLYNLAVVCEQEGQYQQAEQFYLRVLALDERLSGPDHLNTAKTLNNLAVVYYLQGHYPKAEATYQRTLTIYKNFLPSNHPDLAYLLNGQGALAEKRGDDERAAELYNQAFTIREQALGKAHSETAQSINKLARIYELRSDYPQALSHYQQALTITEQTLGPEHPESALILNNLALLAYKQGHYQQAESLYQRALSIYELTPGVERPAVASVLNNLGQLYHKTNDELQAEAVLRQALAIREQVPGMLHPDTAQSLSNLGALLIDQHRYTEAEPLFQQALAILLQTVGPAYPQVSYVRERYASLLERTQRHEEAMRLRQTIVEEQ